MIEAGQAMRVLAPQGQRAARMAHEPPGHGDVTISAPDEAAW